MPRSVIMEEEEGGKARRSAERKRAQLELMRHTSSGDETDDTSRAKQVRARLQKRYKEESDRKKTPAKEKSSDNESDTPPRDKTGDKTSRKRPSDSRSQKDDEVTSDDGGEMRKVGQSSRDRQDRKRPSDTRNRKHDEDISEDGDETRKVAQSSRDREEYHTEDESEFNGSRGKKSQRRRQSKSPSENKYPETQPPEEEDEEEDPTECYEDLFKSTEEEEEAAFRRLKGSLRDPTPRSRFILVNKIHGVGRNTFDGAREHFITHSQDDLGIHISPTRPVYIVWCHRKPHGFQPHLTMLDIGNMKKDELNKVGFFADPWQANMPKSASPNTPIMSQVKLMLPGGDTEFLRRQGNSLIRMGEEYQSKRSSKPKVVVMSLDDSDSTTESDAEDNGVAWGEVRPTRVFFYVDDENTLNFRFYRVSSVVSGGKVECDQNDKRNQFTLTVDELRCLIGWIEPMFEETARLTSSRISVPTPMTSGIKNGFRENMLNYLVKKVRDADPERLVSKKNRRELLSFICEIVRCTTSISMKKQFNTNRGRIEHFQAFHTSMMLSRPLAELANEVRSIVRSSLTMIDE